MKNLLTSIIQYRIAIFNLDRRSIGASVLRPPKIFRGALLSLGAVRAPNPFYPSSGPFDGHRWISCRVLLRAAAKSGTDHGAGMIGRQSVLVLLRVIYYYSTLLTVFLLVSPVIIIITNIIPP